MHWGPLKKKKSLVISRRPPPLTFWREISNQGTKVFAKGLTAIIYSLDEHHSRNQALHTAHFSSFIEVELTNEKGVCTYNTHNVMIWHMLTVKYLSQSSNQDGLLWWLSSNLPASAGVSGSIPASKRSPREGNGNRTSILPGKTHGERSLAGHSPLGCKRVAHDLATQNTHQLPIPMFVCVCVCVWWEHKISSLGKFQAVVTK